jgi:FMN phosphatase YigB (HAD superfamily)
MKNKLILTDCDGVLLHWEWSFDRWMTRHGYLKDREGHYDIEYCYGISKETANRLVEQFNETVYAGNIPPFLDAIRYVHKLHQDHGFVFHVITSIGNEPEIVESRRRNLHRVFGESAFYRITCLSPNVTKQTVLEQYRGSGCWWLEDNVSNYNLGNQLGLTSLLVSQHYNISHNAGNSRVNNWKQIYKRITNDV